MNQRLFVNLQNRDNCGIDTLSFIWRSGCYANNLDMELCIKFLTCAIDLDDIREFLGVQNYWRQFGNYVKTGESQLGNLNGSQ